jgi:hypothetical protein
MIQDPNKTCEQKYDILKDSWPNFWRDYGVIPSANGWGTVAYDNGAIDFYLQIGDVL